MEFSPIMVSLKTVSCSIALTFFLGVMAAWFVAGLKHREFKMILDGILTLPLALPPTVAGFFLLYIFGARGPAGRFFLEVFDLKIAFSWAATVLASVVVSFPLMYRAARGALEQMDITLIQDARTLGLGEWGIFWQVRLPVSMPGIASGAVLTFARGLGEFGATSMIAGNIAGRTRTLPLAVYSAVAAGDMGAAWIFVGILAVISFLVVALLNWPGPRVYNP